MNNPANPALKKFITGGRGFRFTSFDGSDIFYCYEIINPLNINYLL